MTDLESALVEAAAALESASIPYMLIGGWPLQREAISRAVQKQIAGRSVHVHRSRI